MDGKYRMKLEKYQKGLIFVMEDIWRGIVYEYTLDRKWI